MASVRAAYRSALRAVDTHVTAVSGNGVFRDYVRAAFRGDADAARRLQDAEDYAFLVNSVHEHKELLWSYGISLDKEQIDKDRMRNTAKHVGLSMPEPPPLQ
mmetsp:Transcript_30636/g.99604  ORF Transcript_30636/g.99604 Transcript_30636/m.99604 type:complete len:102 (+) Transcript_30636:49-354(+)